MSTMNPSPGVPYTSFIFFVFTSYKYSNLFAAIQFYNIDNWFAAVEFYDIACVDNPATFFFD